MFETDETRKTFSKNRVSRKNVLWLTQSSICEDMSQVCGLSHAFFERCEEFPVRVRCGLIGQDDDSYFLSPESIDAMRRGIELGKQLGHARRTRDLLSWVKKKRRHVRREELIGYLCGVSPPPPGFLPPPARGPAHRAGAAHALRAGAHHHRAGRTLLHHRTSADVDPAEPPDLSPFRDALALQSKWTCSRVSRWPCHQF